MLPGVKRLVMSRHEGLSAGCLILDTAERKGVSVAEAEELVLTSIRWAHAALLLGGGCAYCYGVCLPAARCWAALHLEGGCACC